ncbi:MAG: alanine racemase [Thermoanaerobaculia bacterium]
MPTIDDLPTPALVLDLDKLENNIATMASKCELLGVALRPHIKTHKCVEIGRIQIAHGARGITVATLYEAKRFAEAGFDDITWAFPIPLSRIEEAVDLGERITLRVIVDSERAIDELERRSATLDVLLKIDCGYHRAGVEPSDPLAASLARRLAESPSLRFDGLLTHSGQAYSACGSDELAQIAELERRIMAEFAGELRAEGIDVPTVSVGSTPAMSAVLTLDGVNEARPGNYVFFDHMQTRIGSCRVADCALTIVASAVSAGRNHTILDAGALALSKDSGRSDVSRPNFGCGFHSYENAALDPRLRVVSLSQEHGWLTGSHAVGTRFRILPQHSCMTAALFDEYVVVRGEEVVDRWPILRGRD